MAGGGNAVSSAMGDGTWGGSGINPHYSLIGNVEDPCPEPATDIAMGLFLNSGNFAHAVPLTPGIVARGFDPHLFLVHNSGITYDGPYGHNWTFHKDQSVVTLGGELIEVLPPGIFHALPQPGDLVRHRRYGYRGVVVQFELQCAAPDSWYQANRTQPVRQQPWYHVLVHDSEGTTYAAQENLQPDPSGSPVVHPLIDEFFTDYVAGRYVRNQRPWPQW